MGDPKATNLTPKQTFIWVGDNLERECTRSQIGIVWRHTESNLLRQNFLLYGGCDFVRVVFKDLKSFIPAPLFDESSIRYRNPTSLKECPRRDARNAKLVSPEWRLMWLYKIYGGFTTFSVQPHRRTSSG